MWGSCCSGNTQKTNLRQFFAVVHWARQGALLEKFKENNLCKSQLFTVTNKGKPPRIFSLACNLLKVDAYSNDFEKMFLAKSPCNCNQIRSNQIAASANALSHFHF